MSAEKDNNDDHRVERVGTSASGKSSDNDIADHQEKTTNDGSVAQWVEGTLEEKRLVRKLDWRILPCTWVLYLLGFLDRANIGFVDISDVIHVSCLDDTDIERTQKCEDRWSRGRFQSYVGSIFHHRLGLLHFISCIRSPRQHDPHPCAAKRLSPRIGTRLGNFRCTHGRDKELASASWHAIPAWVRRGKHIAIRLKTFEKIMQRSRTIIGGLRTRLCLLFVVLVPKIRTRNPFRLTVHFRSDCWGCLWSSCRCHN